MRTAIRLSAGARSSTAAALQIGEPGFPDYPCMAVHLAIDLVLKHAIGFGQLAHDNKDLAAIGKLSQVGAKGDLLANRKFMCWHLDQAQKPYWMARQIKSKAKQKARASGDHHVPR